MIRFTQLVVASLLSFSGTLLAQSATPAPAKSSEKTEPWSQYQKDQKGKKDEKAAPKGKPMAPSAGKKGETQPPAPAPSSSGEQPWNKYEKDAKKKGASPEPAASGVEEEEDSE